MVTSHNVALSDSCHWGTLIVVMVMVVVESGGGLVVEWVNCTHSTNSANNSQTFNLILNICA